LFFLFFEFFFPPKKLEKKKSNTARSLHSCLYLERSNAMMLPDRFSLLLNQFFLDCVIDSRRRANMSRRNRVKMMKRGGGGASMPRIRVARVEERKSKLSAAMQEKVRRWQVLYPVYMDSSKTCAEGRRVAKSQGVPSPTLAEIRKACARLGVECVEEDHKVYSRDPIEGVGRCRVKLKIDGEPVHETLRDRRLLLKAVGEMIQQTPKRVAEAKRIEDAKLAKKSQKSGTAGAAASASNDNASSTLSATQQRQRAAALARKNRKAKKKRGRR
jgi:signal recognition particle subunit SRP19